MSVVEESLVMQLLLALGFWKAKLFALGSSYTSRLYVTAKLRKMVTLHNIFTVQGSGRGPEV